MGRGLFPDRMYESAYTVPYDRFYEEGYRGIIYDIDNTLVMPDAPADERSKKLIAELKESGYAVTVVSNNKGPRVASFAEAVGIPYVPKALKPTGKGYVKAMEIMGTDPGTTITVGDQIYTDIFCARRAGVLAVAVRPIDARAIHRALRYAAESPFRLIAKLRGNQ